MKKSDSINWKIYESITKYIYQTLGQRSGIKIDGYGKNCKIRGKSGVKHQIDVLTLQPDGITTAIECKYWNKKVTKDTVMKLFGIIHDTTVDKGIIVSKSGYTKDALSFARHYNIDIVELREYDDSRKEPIAKQHEIASILIKADCTVHRPEILKITAHPSEKEIDLADMYKIQIAAAPSIRFPLSIYVEKFQKELHDQHQVSEVITKRYNGLNAFLIHAKENYPIKINSLSLTGVLTKTKSQHNSDILLTDNVSLIMKSIFEERTFSISEHGIIMEHRKESR